MSVVKSQREQTNAAEELEEGARLQRIVEEIEVYKMKPGLKHYCEHSARLPVCSSQSARPIGPHTLFKASTASTAGGT
jgi:hypothetical protein